MGQLIDGVWSDEWYDTKSSGGRFVRKESAFRDWLHKPVCRLFHDGSAEVS